MTMEEVNDNILDLSRRTSSSSASPRPISRSSSDYSHHKDSLQSNFSSIASDDKSQMSPRSTPSDVSMYGQMVIDTKAFQSTIPQLGSMVPQMSSAVFPGSYDPLNLAGTAAGVNPLNPLGLGVNPSDMTSMSDISSAPWGFYLNHITGRKRKVPAQNDGSTSPKQIKNEEKKDDAYWDRRRKNNEAAKRSRDARRQKEEEIALRAAFLEQENLKLRAQVTILKNESAKLHFLLYNRSNTQVATSPSS